MDGRSVAYLRCSTCRGTLARGIEALRCTQCDRSFPLDDGIPVLLDQDAPGMRETIAALDAETARYALVLGAISAVAMIWLPAERRRLIGRVGLRAGDTVLDHCAGPGGNFPAIAAAIGPSGRLVAMDLSRAMARQARRFARRKRIEVDIHQADALSLPYADDCFDAVVHAGAVNQFGDGKRRVVAEMVRVTRPGGTITIIDEGIEPGRERAWWARLLIRRNGLFASRPPLDVLPAGVDPEVEWVLRGLFYQIVFHKPSS
jgi:SAM-dependent methyltransferase